MSTEEIEDKIANDEIDIYKVIDAIINVNGYIGVGLIGLGDHLKNYCYHHKGYLKGKIDYDSRRIK